MRRSLTAREWILLGVLAVLALASGYMMLFYLPSTSQRDTAREETGLYQLQTEAAQLRLAEKRRMERELEEETGYRCDKLEFLMRMNTTVAFCDEAIDIFVARNLISSHQHLDEDEVVYVEEWDLKDLEEMIYAGKLTDAKTTAAILAYARKYS